MKVLAGRQVAGRVPVNSREEAASESGQSVLGNALLADFLRRGREELCCERSDHVRRELLSVKLLIAGIWMEADALVRWEGGGAGRLSPSLCL